MIYTSSRGQPSNILHVQDYWRRGWIKYVISASTSKVNDSKPSNHTKWREQGSKSEVGNSFQKENNKNDRRLVEIISSRTLARVLIWILLRVASIVPSFRKEARLVFSIFNSIKTLKNCWSQVLTASMKVTKTGYYLEKVLLSFKEGSFISKQDTLPSVLYLNATTK